MNDRDIDALLAAGRRVADQLERDCQPIEAEIVRLLCRSRSAARETNRRLYADNAVLRRQLGEEQS